MTHENSNLSYASNSSANGPVNYTEYIDYSRSNENYSSPNSSLNNNESNNFLMHLINNKNSGIQQQQPQIQQNNIRNNYVENQNNMYVHNNFIGLIPNNVHQHIQVNNHNKQ